MPTNAYRVSSKGCFTFLFVNGILVINIINVHSVYLQGYIFAKADYLVKLTNMKSHQN